MFLILYLGVQNLKVTNINIEGPCGIGINISGSSVQISGGNWLGMNYAIVATNSSVTTLNFMNTINNSYTANLTFSSFTSRGALVADKSGVQAYYSRVELFSTLFTINDPPLGMLHAIGGTVNMSNVGIAGSPTDTTLGIPMVYLEDVQANLVKVTIRVFFGPGQQHARGFAIVRSSVVLDTVTVSNTWALHANNSTPSYHNKGGGLYFESSNVTMRGCSISSCIAGKGGGLYSLNSNVTMDGCTFYGNSAIATDADCIFILSFVFVCFCHLL